MPPSLHIATRSSSLQTSIPPYLYIRIPYSSPPDPPDLRASTFAHPQHLQRSNLHISTSARPQLTSELQTSILPAIYTSTPARLQPTSSAPCLYTSMSTQPQCVPSTPYLRIPPRRDTYIESIDLHTSAPPSAHHTARLQSSRAPYLHASTSTRLQRDYRASYLYASTSTHLQPAIHIATLAERLQTSRPPFLHTHSTSSDPYLNTSVSLHLHRASRPPDLRAFTSLHLHRASRPPEPHISTSARLRRGSRAAEL